MRFTELGAEVLEHAVRSAELSEAVESIVSNRLTDVSGTLRLSAMRSVSDTLLTPLVTAFQRSYPSVRVQILVTERMVDLIAEGVDLAFRLRMLKDSCLVARKILTYRYQLVASPCYLKDRPAPKVPADLLNHRLLTFSHWRPTNSKNGKDKETVTFEPYFSMNDYGGLAPALVAGAGMRPSAGRSAENSSRKAISSKLCRTGNSAPTISRSSTWEIATCRSPAACSRTSPQRSRQLCFLIFRRE